VDYRLKVVKRPWFQKCSGFSWRYDALNCIKVVVRAGELPSFILSKFLSQFFVDEIWKKALNSYLKLETDYEKPV
jgi:hypothetical protein